MSFIPLGRCRNMQRNGVSVGVRIGRPCDHVYIGISGAVAASLGLVGRDRCEVLVGVDSDLGKLSIRKSENGNGLSAYGTSKASGVVIRPSMKTMELAGLAVRRVKHGAEAVPTELVDGCLIITLPEWLLEKGGAK